jgi:hypothetical protein
LINLTPVETENTTGSSSKNFIKTAKIIALWAALFGRAWAAELNKDDAGDCVPLNKEQQPLNLKIIYLF